MRATERVASAMVERRMRSSWVEEFSSAAAAQWALGRLGSGSSSGGSSSEYKEGSEASVPAAELLSDWSSVNGEAMGTIGLHSSSEVALMERNGRFRNRFDIITSIFFFFYFIFFFLKI